MIDKYYVPNGATEETQFLKGMLYACDSLIEEIGEIEEAGQIKGYEAISIFIGLVHNKIEDINKFIEGDSDE